MAKYCQGGAITELQICCNYLEPVENDLLQQLRMVFSRLKMLRIDCNFIEAENLYTCRKLVELTIVGATIDNNILQVFESNRQLKYLQIDAIVSTYICRLIGLYLPELEDLHIINITNNNTNLAKATEDLMQLVRLSHLKVLSLECTGLPVQALFDAISNKNLPIEELNLFNVDSAVVHSLSKLRYIKQLTMSSGQWSKEKLAMVKRMKSLKYIQIIYFGKLRDYVWNKTEIIEIISIACELSYICFDGFPDVAINERDFIDLAQAIKNRGNNVPLNIDFMFSTIKFNVSEYIVEKYCEWLKITINKNELQGNIGEFY